MAPRKKYEDELTERMEALENFFKKKLKKIEEKNEQEKEEWEIRYNEKLEKIKKEHEQDMKDMKEQISEMQKKLDNSTNEYKQTARNSNIEISKPTFYGNDRDMHPIDFLSKVNDYFKVKQITREEKMLVIGDCLRGSASNWLSTMKFQVRDYTDFRDAFIEEFWSREIQIQVLSKCHNINQIPNNVSYREHFAQWATRLQHLQVPQLSEEEILRNIANHYPKYLRAMLMSLPEQKINAAMKLLSTEEHHRENNDQSTPHNDNYNEQRPPPRNNNWNGSRPPVRNNHWNGPRNNRANVRSNPQSNTVDNQQSEQINQIQYEEGETHSNEEKNKTSEPEITNHTVNNIPTNKKSVSPYLQCYIEGEPVQLLIDTGATISVLTKEVVDILLRKNPTIPVLPVSGVQISNAVGKRICKISKQVYCACRIGNANIFANFIQIENLNEKGIIGADVLNQYHVQVDFQNKEIHWTINQQIHTTQFANTIPKQVNENEQIKDIETVEESIDKASLKEHEAEEFDNLLKKYEHLFSDSPAKIRGHECQIKVTPGDPIYQRPYPIPMSKLEKMDREIQRMLELGIIEQSTSPWSSPIVGVEKKNGEIRLCLDARKINTRIIPDRECPPNIDDILTKFQGAKYLSSIDLTAGYWQCSLKRECREVTAFLYRGRNYQFQVLPFGLINSVAEFQKMMDKVLGPEVLQFTAVYVDDIHVASTTFREHIQRLETIFQRFNQFNVKINLGKSHFLRNSIVFLGHVISEKGIAMDPEKVRTIQNFQPPQNRKQVQSFLGFINFYRRYIRDLSKYTEVLSRITRKGSEWIWKKEQQEAFEQIKKHFLEDIIVEYPDYKQDFYLSTDASRTHIGAELYQINEQGQHRTLGFISRTLKPPERQYYTTELELLAIVFGCQKYRNYILGYPIHILTDHKALTFLNSCQLLNARLMRWSIKLQEYNLQITHIAGKDNIGADTLTRYPQEPGNTECNAHTDICIHRIVWEQYSKSLTQQFSNLHELQNQDRHIQSIKERIARKQSKDYCVYQNLLFYVDKFKKHRVMIPAVIAKALISETHELYGHFGASKTYNLLKQNYQLHHMYKEVKNITKSCELCQKSKIPTHNSRGPFMAQVPERPREVISLDLIGPLPKGRLGSQYILVLLDIFTKHLQLYDIRKATAEIILNRIKKHYLPKYGPINRILTDNGTQFHSTKWREQLKQLGIKASVTTTYHPEGNPVERANREIGRILRTYCHRNHTNWVQYLPKIEYWMNNTTHSSTGFTPQELVDGNKITLTLNSLINFPEAPKPQEQTVMLEMAHKKLKKTANQRCEYHNKNKTFIQYKEGQQVLIKLHKLSSASEREIKKMFLLYHGPYVIKEVRSNNTVVIIGNDGKLSTHNMANIKPFIPPDPGKGQYLM